MQNPSYKQRLGYILGFYMGSKAFWNGIKLGFYIGIKALIWSEINWVFVSDQGFLSSKSAFLVWKIESRQLISWVLNLELNRHLIVPIWCASFSRE